MNRLRSRALISVGSIGLVIGLAGCGGGGGGSSSSGGGSSSASAQSVASQFIDDVTSGQTSAALGLAESGNSTITGQLHSAISQIAAACHSTPTVQMVSTQADVAQADFEINDQPCQGTLEVRVLGSSGWKIDQVQFEGETLVY